MKRYLDFKISKKDDGKKILTFLKSDLGLSTLKIRSVKFTAHGIMQNGEPATVGSFLRAGDTLTILRSDSDHKERHLLANPLPLSILYEDDAIIILNKPAGMVCHPSRGHLTDSLANGVRAYFDETDPDANVHLLGRLDRDTSGLVLMAKDGITADAIARMKDTGEFKKEYIAITEGSFQEASGTIDFPIETYHTEDGILKNRRADALSEADANASRVTSSKNAITHYRVLYSSAEYSVLNVHISTGRMHQIRFHMAEIGHPLLGDALYGHGVTHFQESSLTSSENQNCVTDSPEHFFPEAHTLHHVPLSASFAPETRMLRHALHAYRLTFRHPYTNELIHVTAALPADMNLYIPEKILL